MQCPKCGSMKFSSNITPEAPEKLSLPEDNVSIQMHARGIFTINLEDLSHREEKDPLVVQDAKGSIHFQYNPDL